MKTLKPSAPRRDFLGKILMAWGALSVVPVVNVIVRYLTPTESLQDPALSVRLDNMEPLEANSSKVVRFGKEPVIVVRTPAGQYKAFQARCTHLGCVVKYNSEGPPGFHCNCHGSTFDLTGRNLSGPAPSPLRPVKVTLDQNTMILTKVGQS